MEVAGGVPPGFVLPEFVPSGVVVLSGFGVEDTGVAAAGCAAAPFAPPFDGAAELESVTGALWPARVENIRGSTVAAAMSAMIAVAAPSPSQRLRCPLLTVVTEGVIGGGIADAGG